MTRRSCFTALFGFAAPIERHYQKNKRVHHSGIQIFKGVLELPTEVIEHALQSPLFRTTHRHEAVRFKLHGTIFLFRELAETTTYVGEIVQTPEGSQRVHLFKVAFVGSKPKFVFTFASLVPPVASEDVDYDAPAYSQYCDPKYAEQLMDEAMPAPQVPLSHLQPEDYPQAVPLVPPVASEDVDYDAPAYSQYCDPKYAEQLMDEAMPAPQVPQAPLLPKMEVPQPSWRS